MPEAEKGNKKGVWILWLIAVGIFSSFFIFGAFLIWFGLSGNYSTNSIHFPGKEKIGLVEIIGPIYNSQPIVDQLEDFGGRDDVYALVLRIDSPGGSVVAAQEVFRELQKLREREGMVVLTSMGNAAASGGYYIACASDLIVASPGTITGSIGVIASWTQYDDLLGWARLKNVVIKSGELKDAGNPAREMTREERAYHQQLVDELHQQFLSVVAESRGLNEEVVASLGDGRVFTGNRALELDLIDAIGNLSDTLEMAADMAGLDEYLLLERRKDRPLDFFDLLEGQLMRRVASRLGGSSGAAGEGSGFHYLWGPPNKPGMP